MYRHILIPSDGSDLAEKAVEAGIEFARSIHARVTGFTAVPEYRTPSEAELMAKHVISLAEYEEQAKRNAERILERIAARARAAGRRVRRRLRPERPSLRGDRARGRSARLRPDLHGLARPA